VTTAREFLASDAPTGSELINGVVHLNDVSFEHQELCGRLVVDLSRWDVEGVRGASGFGGNWVLSATDVFKPDVWWTSERPRGASHQGPPDLAVEIREVGTWARDAGPKLRRYEAAGAAELWLVDSPACSVLVFRREGAAGFESAFEFGPGEQLTSPLLPGFTLAIDELFAGLA